MPVTVADVRAVALTLPRATDLRFNWVCARADKLDVPEMAELAQDAWAMVVPKFLVRERLGFEP